MSQLWHDYIAAADRDFERSKQRSETLFPHYSEDGRWELLDISELSSWGSHYEHGNWTAGFWFGVMWLTSLGTGNEAPADLARARLDLLAPRATDHTTHDLGFLFHPSVVFGYQCGLLPDSVLQHADAAARMTVRRFNEQGRYIQAFGPVGDERSAGTSTIDTMMNLPLLWWAAQATGEPAFVEVARHHARTSARLLVRPDGSTVHLMHLDPISGSFLEEATLQGASAKSAWSRGQAWAICGFAWSYAVTGEPELLAAADRAADYYLRNVAPDHLPAWDFTALGDRPPRDASAAAVTALGFQILGLWHPDPDRRDSYRSSADRALDAIGRLALNRDVDVEGILLQSNYSVPHGRGVDGATAWGDFYLGLAAAVQAGVLGLEQLIGVQPPTISSSREEHSP